LKGTFAPAVPGLAKGGVVLADSSGTPLATANLYGTGLGAGLTMDPGTPAVIGSGLVTPMSVALDAAGDLFVADSSAANVWEIPAGNGAPVAIGSGFKSPEGVALDGAGNVYVADTGNNQIVLVPVINGVLSTAAQSVLVSSSTSVAGAQLNSPAGVSTDALGNLYIADTGNSRIVYLPYNGGWAISEAFTLGSGWSNPLAVTVATSGLIYVADSGNGKVYSIPYAANVLGRTVVATGFSDPSALATDAAGDLFVVDKGNTQVVRIPNISGSLVTASELKVSFGIADPYGLAIDGAGNLYVSDNVNAAAYAVTRTSSTLSLGKWNPGSTSDPGSFYIEDSGNQALTLGTPYYVATGDTAAFSIATSGASACANGASIAVGADCTLTATFTPAALASYSETLALSSNGVNAASPQAVFTGIGAVTAATQTTLAVTSPSGTPYYGEAVILSATVASVTASDGTPIGTVALLVDGVQAATATLKSGTATFTLANGIGGGNHTLQAQFQGGETSFVVYSDSDSPTLTISVSQVATAASVAFTPIFTNPVSQPAGSALTFVATVTPAKAGLPTGTVTFIFTDSNGTNLTSPPIALAPASGGVFQASYTLWQSTSATDPSDLPGPSGVPFDVVSVAATYGGDTNFSGSTSASQSFDVGPAGGSIAVTSSAKGFSNGGSLTFTNTSYGGWYGVVGYQCEASSLPANTLCVFSPGQVTVTAGTVAAPYPPATTTLTVLVNNPPNSPVQSSMLWWLGGLTGLLLFWMRRRMMRGVWATVTMAIGAVLLVVSASALVACTSGTSYMTPKGTTTITVIADTDPFTTPPTSSNTNPPTQPCGKNSSGVASPALAPCSQPTFQISLTVQ